MSEDWPRGWYSNEPDQPGAAGQRPQPSFTPSSQRQGSPGWGSGAADASQNAWPAQPPSRSWTGGSAGTGGPGRRGWRRWLRPRRLLVILASLVALAVLATVAVYFSVNSKLTRINVLVPTSFTSAGTNWLIAGSDSRGGLTKQQENQLALGHDHAPAPAGQRHPSHAGQHPARLLRADPRLRLQQAQRRLRDRRPEAADRDRAERHRAACQPLHEHRVRRPGQRG